MSFFNYSIRKILIHTFIVICLSVLLGFLFLKLYLPMYTNHGETVSVPDLNGYTYDEGIDILENASLEYEVSVDSGAGNVHAGPDCRLR